MPEQLLILLHIPLMSNIYPRMSNKTHYCMRYKIHCVHKLHIHSPDSSYKHIFLLSKERPPTDIPDINHFPPPHTIIDLLFSIKNNYSDFSTEWVQNKYSNSLYYLFHLIFYNINQLLVLDLHRLEGNSL